MYSSAALSSAEVGDLRYVAPVDVAGRTWTVSCSPAKSAARSLGAEPWLVLLGALAFTTIVAIYLSARARAEVENPDRLLRAKSGAVRVFGLDPVADPVGIVRVIRAGRVVYQA